jgi:hypothetical protein
LDRYAGEVLGQAAWFDTITREDGTTFKLNAPREVLPEEIDAAEAAVAEQANKARTLLVVTMHGSPDAWDHTRY